MLTDDHADEVLQGGVANAGAVVRRGDEVLRPTTRHSEGINRFLVAAREAGFHGASLHLGRLPDGRDRFGYIEGDVAVPPYPAWVGRRTYDVAAFARMCVPIDDDVNSERLGWDPADRPARLRLVADTYGLDTAGRQSVLSCLDHVFESNGAFVRRRVEAGEASFIAMWNAMGGAERFDRRLRWWNDRRASFARAMH